MLEVMWKICPKDGFRARMTDNPNQEFLIKPEPNLQPVKIWLRRFQSKAISYEEIWQQIQDSTEGIPYLKKHLNSRALGFCWTPNCDENESEITRRCV